VKQWIAPALLVLAGCVGTRLDNGLQALVGQNLSAAVQVLGYPDGARTITGGTMYVWSSNSCTLQITADATYRIKRGQYSGNPADCARYEKALNRL
jgi:hypothetical protein